MRFRALSIMNFLSFGSPDVIVQLDRRGLVAVFGHNKDSVGADSNGAGKSTIMEALVWVLFGETLRGYKSDDVIHRGVGKDCRVSLLLEDAGNAYQIIRTRKFSGAKKPNDLVLKVNGNEVTAGTVSDTQQLVTTVLGMDRRTFSQAVLLRSRDRSFSEMTDREQKEVLEDILHIEELSKARDVVKSRVAVRQSDLSKVLVRLEDFDEQLRQSRIRLGKMEQSQSQHSAHVDNKRKSLFRKKVEAEAEIEEKYRSTGLDVLLKSLEDLDEKHTEQSNLYASCYEKASEIQASNGQKRTENAQQLGSIDGQMTALSNDSQSVSQLAGQQCPSCRQHVDPENADQILEVWDKQLNQLKVEKAKIEKRNKRLNTKEKKDLQGLVLEQAKYKEAVSKLAAQRVDLTQQIHKRENTLQLICQLEQQVFHVVSEMDQLDAAENPFGPLVDEIDEEIVAMERERRRWTYKSKSLDLELRHLLFWDHGFGNQGLKSYVLDNVVPFLTKQAQHYADILSGGDLRIEFATQTKLKSGAMKDNFQVKVTNKQGADVYAGNSDGEKRRIDIAVGWALGDLAATRAKKPIRFKGLDEPFENLDETGEDAVIRLFHSVVGEYETIMAITHSTHLSSQFPAELVVTKENGFSTVS